MLVGTRVPPNIQRTLDHHGILWRQITEAGLRSYLLDRGDEELASRFSTVSVTGNAAWRKPAQGSEKRTFTKSQQTPGRHGRRHFQGNTDQVIKVIAPLNPKRPGTKAHERFGYYRSGMTVGDYVAMCKSHSAPRAEDALLDISWDVDRGYIELLPSGTPLQKT